MPVGRVRPLSSMREDMVTMPKKPSKARLTDQPMSIRIPADLRDRVDALTPQIGTQSAVLRLALLEGMKVLERRYKPDP